MTPDVVVDIGNSRIKWGRDYSTDWLYMINSMRRLGHNDPDGWTAAAREWGLHPGTRWVVSGVNPLAQEQFVAWCHERGDVVQTIDRYDQIPLGVEVDHPDRVGLDRLFGALAAANYYPGIPCVVLDIGTAMTVNFVLPERRFVGGAILPGPRLMATALHQYTAKLPLIDPRPLYQEEYVWSNTETAIAAGINAAIVGAARELIGRFASDNPGRLQLYWTGGGLKFLCGLNLPGLEVSHLPAEGLTLTGIWLAAEALP